MCRRSPRSTKRPTASPSVIDAEQFACLTLGASAADASQRDDARHRAAGVVSWRNVARGRSGYKELLSRSRRGQLDRTSVVAEWQHVALRSSRRRRRAASDAGESGSVKSQTTTRNPAPFGARKQLSPSLAAGRATTRSRACKAPLSEICQNRVQASVVDGAEIAARCPSAAGRRRRTPPAPTNPVPERPRPAVHRHICNQR